MAKKHKSLLENRVFGGVIATTFYIGLLVALVVAATNMNYVWKWNSVPKYFVYEESVDIEAPFDGVVTIDKDSIDIKGDEESKEIKIDGYKINVSNGEEVYEGDILASKTALKAGPLLLGLWVTLKISFFTAILALVIGLLLSFMKLSKYHFLKDIAK